MVLGITTMVVGVPAVIGVMEGVRMGQRQNERERHRGRKVNLIASCRTALGESFKATLDGGLVVLRNNKLYIDPPVTEDLEFMRPAGHPFTGYFLPYPNEKWGWKGEGLVSTIMPDPPQLNWIYVDKDTHEIKYGPKVEAQDHHVGPWDCTKLERRMLFDQWEGFMAVKEAPDVWALYFDVDDNGLKDKVHGKRIVEVELSRRERRKTFDDKDDKDFL